MRFTRWGQRSCSDFDAYITQELALWHCNHAGDRGIALADLVFSQDLAGIIAFEVDYSHGDANELRHLRQALAFFQKRRDLNVGIDRRLAAREKFTRFEALCAETNALLQDRRKGLISFRPRVESIIAIARGKISRILGEVPPLTAIRPRFGPGATTQVKRRMASARRKLSEVPACSTNLFPMAKAILKMMPGYASIPGYDEPLVQPGKVVFVPKSAKEDRSVMVEPCLNSMFQLGIGQYISDRLRASGIDIRDQQPNQVLAREGSITGALATLDLSSASDTLALEVVYDLLGIEWATFLSHFRTDCAVMPDGEEIKLAKFSSMGNGFTFPLETLVFYALAHACAKENGVHETRARAYGDDLVIEAGLPAADLEEVLHACGFVVNREKSFATGRFRESCGKDYISGFDVRPVYIKDRITSADVFRLHNHYKRWFAEDPCAFLLDLLDPSIRIYGPDGYGDGHLLGEWDGRRKANHAKRGYGGYVFDTFAYRALRSRDLQMRGDCVLPAYSIYVREDDDGPFRESTGGYQYEGEELSVAVPGRGRVYRASIYVMSAGSPR